MLIKTRLLALLLILIIVFEACSKKAKEDIPIGPSIGPISAKDFASVPPPTFQQVIKAYEDVTSNSPALLQNDSTLSRAIFDWVKAHPNGRLFRIDQDQDSQTYFDLASKLTIEEWKVILLHPVSGYKASGTVKPSLDAAMSKYPCDSDVKYTDGKADALRHAYWNVLLVHRTDAKFAEEFTKAHESESTKPTATTMDLHNNKFGRDLALKYPNATDEQLLELLIEQKFFYLENPNDPIPSNADNALVYFTAKREYDGTLTGSFSNPDSGGPWNASFDLNQCGDIIRGQLTIVRGSSTQKRRFKGTLNANGTMSLTVSDPYVFENPTGLQYCTNMLMALTGNSKALQGKWTSSNCFQGGTVNISR